MTLQAWQAADLIRQRAPQAKPKLGIILGSGLGTLVEHLENSINIAYEELPNFPHNSQQIAGHAGNFVIGELNGVSVACLQGRAHFYQGYNGHTIKTMIRTLAALGCEALFVTNAAGSLRTDMPPGSLMLITDHINMQFQQPLVGENEEDWGPRFNSMNDAYDAKWRENILQQAKTLDIKLEQGIYIGVLGPSYETPAEIRAFKQFGADAVGMSTVADVIVARHCGLKVAAMSIICNFAAGLVQEPPNHEEVLEYADLAAKHLTQLLNQVVTSL